LPEQAAAFVKQLEASQSLSLAQTWRVPGDHGEAWLLRFVRASDKSSHQLPFVLWAGPDQVFGHLAYNTGRELAVSTDPAHHRFTVRLTGAERTFGVRDGRVVEVALTRTGPLDGMGEGSQTEDWDTLTFHRTLEKGEGKQREVLEADEGAILLVTQDDASALPRTWTTVTDGKARRHGPRDASFQVRAEPAEAGVALRIRVRDNTHVPVPARGSPRAFAAADHLELWWRSPAGLRQVGVGVDAEGKAQVRALYLKDPKLPLPTVSVEDGELIVQFDAPSLGGDAAIAQGVPFTVAFADVDRKGRGVESVVSTSAFHFRVSTLGILRALPGFARWPTSRGETPWCPVTPEDSPGQWSGC
jgi:hypothetical protein